MGTRGSESTGVTRDRAKSTVAHGKNIAFGDGVVGGGSMRDRVAAHSHAEEPADHLHGHAVAVVGVGMAVACGMTVLAPLLS